MHTTEQTHAEVSIESLKRTTLLFQHAHTFVITILDNYKPLDFCC